MNGSQDDQHLNIPQGGTHTISGGGNVFVGHCADEEQAQRGWEALGCPTDKEGCKKTLQRLGLNEFIFLEGATGRTTQVIVDAAQLASLAGRQSVETQGTGVRILHIPAADEHPMQVYEVRSLNEAAEIVSIPGEGKVSVLANVSATDGHRLYWNDSADGNRNARGTDIARAYGAIDARGQVHGDVVVVGPHPDLDVSNDAIREIVNGYEFDIDWHLYGERTPEGHPVDNARNYLNSIDNEKLGEAP